MPTWEDIQDSVEIAIKQIFKDKPIYTLSDYERRKIIFEHLTKTLEYDFDHLNALKRAQANNEKISRDPTQELLSVINADYGICNGISQYYKLLLERIGIKAHCVICDDTTEINHQMVLVYNQETDTYSFDDVTGVIVGRGTNEEYFDYDVETANKYGQGLKSIFEERCFVILPEEYINFVVKRTISPTKTLEYLPQNIKSLKQKSSVKWKEKYMKKTLLIILSILTIFTITGCAKKEIKEPVEEITPSKISIEVKEGSVTNKQATFIYKNTTKFSYDYGPEFALEKYKDDLWVALPINEGIDYITQVFTIEAESTVEEKINWTMEYNKLEPGKYRLVKTFMNENERVSSKVEFEIK